MKKVLVWMYRAVEFVVAYVVIMLGVSAAVGFVTYVMGGGE